MGILHDLIWCSLGKGPFTGSCWMLEKSMFLLFAKEAMFSSVCTTTSYTVHVDPKCNISRPHNDQVIF